MRSAKKIGEIDEKTPLLTLAGPIFFEMFLNIAINNIDTLMLSRHSESAVGAVGNANQIMMLMIIMFNIIATATSIVVAQYLGAGKKAEMNRIYTMAFLVNLLFGIVISSGLVLSQGLIYKIVQIPAEMLPEAKLYMTIVGGGLFFQACYNVLLQILRCNGHTKMGMYVSIIINLINIVGNYTFLYGPLKFLNLGVVGVAISTVTARAVAVTVAIVYFYRKKIGKLALRFIRPFPWKMLGDMIKIGIPSAGENLSYNTYQIVLLSFVNSMGPDAVNAKVYCNSLISFALVFGNAAAMATQIITGHLVGAGKEDAAYKRAFSTLKVSLPITVVLSVINCVFCPFTLHLFTDNPKIIQIGFYVMLVDIAIEIGRCINMTFVYSCKAAGDYVFPFVIGLITMWIFGVPTGYGLGILAGFGVAGVFAGTMADECLRAVFVFHHWRTGKWRGKALVKK